MKIIIFLIAFASVAYGQINNNTPTIFTEKIWMNKNLTVGDGVGGDTLKVRGNFGVGALNPVARVHFRLGSGGFSTFGLVGDSSVQFSTYDSTTDVRYLFSINGYSDIFSITRDSTGAGGDHSVSINAAGVLVNGLSPFQNLSISNDTLSIENGNSVVLPSSGGGIEDSQRVSSLVAGAAGWMMAYNGQNEGVSAHRLGLAFSHDGYYFQKSGLNPIIPLGAGGTFDDVQHAQPCLLRTVNNYIYIYYSAYDGANYTIGMSYSQDGGNTWTKYGQVLALGSGGTWDDNQVQIPFVIEEPDEPDTTQRFKMWYTGNDGSTAQLGYAYSADGFTWTKYASNPVIPVGGGGAWDAAWVTGTSPVYKEGSTYNIFYMGFPSGMATSSVGIATFTDPKSTYTKFGGNPVLSPKTSATQNLTANLTAGNVVVTVASTAAFEVNESVILQSTASVTNDEVNRIKSIDSGTQLTLWNPVVNSYTTATTAKINSVYSTKLLINSIIKQDDSFLYYGTAFGVMPTRERELSVAFTSETITTGFDFGYNYGVVLPAYETAAWDRTSAENPAIIASPEPNEMYVARYGAYVNRANTFTANQRVNGVLSVSIAPQVTWSGVSPVQIGTDLTMWDSGNGLTAITSNLSWNGSAFKYINARKASALLIGHAPGGVTGSIGIGMAGTGSAGATATVAVPFGFTNTGNFVIGAETGTMTVGTNAVGTIVIGNATAPASSPADQSTLYAADQAAGNSCIHTRTENGAIIKLYQQANIPDADSSNIVTKFNTLLQYMENLGFIAP